MQHVFNGVQLLAQGSHAHIVADIIVVFALQPLFQRFHLKRRADAGIDQDLVVAHALELLFVEQDHVFIEASADDLRLFQQLLQGHVLDPLGLLFRLAAAAVIANLGAKILQGVGQHRASGAQAQDAHFLVGDLRGPLLPLVGAKAVEQADQLADHKFDHAVVAIIPDAGHHNALFPCLGNVHVGAFFIVQAAAHADVADGWACLDDAAVDLAGKGDQHAIGIANAADDLFIALGNVCVFHILFAQLLEPGHPLCINAYRLNGHDLFKHFHDLLRDRSAFQ